MNTRLLKRVALGLAIMVLGFCAHAARNVMPEQVYCDIVPSIVMVNSDNDDNNPNGYLDYDSVNKPKPVIGDKDLVALELAVKNANPVDVASGETATLSVDSPNAYVRVWQEYTPTATANNPNPPSTWTLIIDANHGPGLWSFTLNNYPFSVNYKFWVEGLAPSADIDDVSFTLATGAGNIVALAAGAGNQGPNSHADDKVTVLPQILTVTDFATLSDVLPYSATASAKSPKNSELCLRADESTVKAKIQISWPNLPTPAIQSKLKWRVVKEPAESLVADGTFASTSTPVELSLLSGTTVEDEVLFRVQAGVDKTPMVYDAHVDIRVVRDRLNWWFKPFSSDSRWYTAKPEPRSDTLDYPDHKAAAYKRESLQSIYEFFKLDTTINGIPKASWLKPSINCFGQFHEALKSANGNNPLTDLNSLSKLDMSVVTTLSEASTTFDFKYAQFAALEKKQTTFTVEANPKFKITAFPTRVQWVNEVAGSINDPRLPAVILMAIWQAEGSLSLNQGDRVSNENNISTYPIWPLNFVAQYNAQPATADEAKTIYIYEVAKRCMGSDFLLKTVPQAKDNKPDLTDYSVALSYFKSAADGIGGTGIGDRMMANLTATPSGVGVFQISANPAFYKDYLFLVGKYYLSVWRTDPELTYVAFNMGPSKFDQALIPSFSNPNYPERARLSLHDWCVHYEIRTPEWSGARANALKFHAFKVAFENLFP